MLDCLPEEPTADRGLLAADASNSHFQPAPALPAPHPDRRRLHHQQQAALEGPVTANTAGVASASPTGSELNGSLLARTPTASQVADLLAAANGDWAAVIALLTGQASSGAGSLSAGGSGSVLAVGSQPGAAVALNSGSQAGGAGAQ